MASNDYSMTEEQKELEQITLCTEKLVNEIVCYEFFHGSLVPGSVFIALQEILHSASSKITDIAQSEHRTSPSENVSLYDMAIAHAMVMHSK